MNKRKETKKRKAGSLQKLTAKKRAFLRAYAETANITYAARAGECSRNAHYKWLKTDQAYQEIFQEAKQEAIELLEGEARRRAVQGVEEPVYYKGEVVGARQKYSDILLIFLLKALRPEKYRERYEISGGDKPMGGNVNDPGREKFPDDQLDRLIALAKRLARNGSDEGGKIAQ